MNFFKLVVEFTGFALLIILICLTIAFIEEHVRSRERVKRYYKMLTQCFSKKGEK